MFRSPTVQPVVAAVAAVADDGAAAGRSGTDEEELELYNRYIIRDKDKKSNAYLRAAMGLVGVEPDSQFTTIDLALLTEAKVRRPSATAPSATCNPMSQSHTLPARPMRPISPLHHTVHRYIRDIEHMHIRDIEYMHIRDIEYMYIRHSHACAIQSSRASDTSHSWRLAGPSFRAAQVYMAQPIVRRHMERLWRTPANAGEYCDSFLHVAPRVKCILSTCAHKGFMAASTIFLYSVPPRPARLHPIAPPCHLPLLGAASPRAPRDRMIFGK
eukprot:SAG11_NODE_410_length_9703_cov_3.284777_13_plen_271_part_00